MRRLASFLTTFVAVVCLPIGCASGDEGARSETPTAEYDGPGTLHTIEAGTQLHVDGLALGVGNIWEEDYQTADGTAQHGLRAALFISVKADASNSRNLRVHPGLDVVAAGYRLHVISVEESSIRLAVIEQPE